MARWTLLLAIAVVWGLALAAWPGLPDRFPMHFDLAGNPDGWAQKSVLGWFAVPALATAMGLVFGWLLPAWMVRLARSNSRWLNVPQKRLFTQLPVEARERAVRAPAAWLGWLACCIEALFAWILYGSARVASGEWSTLPPWPSFSLLAAVLACALALAVAGSRAVQHEVARVSR